MSFARMLGALGELANQTRDTIHDFMRSIHMGMMPVDFDDPDNEDDISITELETSTEQEPEDDYSDDSDTELTLQIGEMSEGMSGVRFGMR